MLIDIEDIDRVTHIIFFDRGKETVWGREHFERIFGLRNSFLFVIFFGQVDVPELGRETTGDDEFLAPCPVPRCGDFDKVFTRIEPGYLDGIIEDTEVFFGDERIVDADTDGFYVGFEREGAGIDENTAFQTEPVPIGVEEDRGGGNEKRGCKKPE